LVLVLATPAVAASSSPEVDAFSRIHDRAATILRAARTLKESRVRTDIIADARMIRSSATQLIDDRGAGGDAPLTEAERGVVTDIRTRATRISDSAERHRVRHRDRISDAAAAISRIATSLLGETAPLGSAPPAADGYFSLKGPGSLGSLPSGQECAGLVHRSTWEPRPKNTTANHTMPDPAAVHAAFAARPRAPLTNDERWDTWLLPRVDGQFTGTTDEIFQWAACKWGLPDNVLRAQAVRESVWFQYLTDASGACQVNYGCTDVFSSSSAASRVYCDALARIGGYDYQRNFGTGICPKTFGIVSAMSWQDPSWGTWPDNQNGTFPFNRNSTPFVVDYLGAYLRGCYEGWAWWLTRTSGDLWGCVGSWYAGEWHSSAADGYASRVKDEIVNHRWLQASFLLEP
jgi:hypothetical protein